MGRRNEMLLAVESLIAPAIARPEPEVSEQRRHLEVTVVFTSVETTVKALKRAGTLASQLSARITILVPQTVPYPLPITSPPVLIDFSERRFRVLALESPVATTVQIFLCRDLLQTLVEVLKPESLVVVGAHKRWWPTPEKKMARHLQRAGHKVLLVETE